MKTNALQESVLAHMRAGATLHRHTGGAWHVVRAGVGRITDADIVASVRDATVRALRVRGLVRTAATRPGTGRMYVLAPRSDEVSAR